MQEYITNEPHDRPQGRMRASAMRRSGPTRFFSCRSCRSQPWAALHARRCMQEQGVGSARRESSLPSIPLENHGVVCASVIALPVRQSSGVLWSTPAGPQPPSHDLYRRFHTCKPVTKFVESEASSKGRRDPSSGPSFQHSSWRAAAGRNGGWSGAAARLGRSLRAPCLSPSHFRSIAPAAVADRGRANARLSPPRPEQQGSRMGQQDRWRLCWRARCGMEAAWRQQQRAWRNDGAAAARRGGQYAIL